uniref:SAM domain-containing protein n=1 Tax=Alexandrium catenella TaxID=2925 RepID=A0A7S1QVC4_ALECA
MVGNSGSGSEPDDQAQEDDELMSGETGNPTGSSSVTFPLKAHAPSGSADEAASDFSEGQLARWCEDLQLPADLVSRLEAEDVADPRELAAVSDGDLAAFVSGIKIGPKGRFLTAVRKMRQELVEEGTE